VRLALAGAVLFLLLHGAAEAGGISTRLWDARGCWIDRARRDAPARSEREEVGGAKRVRGKEPNGYVAFTFDDGPSEHTTTGILDTLDEYDVAATFFVVGWRLQTGRRGAADRIRVLSDIAGRDHLIGNHTFRHRKLDTLGAKRQRAEIDKTHDAIQQLLGFRPYLFRAPYGRMTGHARRHLESRDYTEVRWSIDPTDFLIKDPERLRKRVIDQIIADGGGVVLLHDTKPWTASALPMILDDLAAENCRRRKAGETLIVPVSLHYFIRNEDGSRRPIPARVENRTDRYLQGLRRRCNTRIDKAQATN
jgi:peptidoglycan/xylan/chitin deacetylase (PgdA/CDA1 family)